MKLRILPLAPLAALALLSALANTAAAPAGAADGKQIFTDLKCSMCHAVSSAGIEAKNKTGPMAGGDLAKVGASRDRDWLVGFLRQEKDVDGKKHKSKFAGTPEQLDALADWLVTLK